MVALLGGLLKEEFPLTALLLGFFFSNPTNIKKKTCLCVVQKVFKQQGNTLKVQCVEYVRIMFKKLKLTECKTVLMICQRCLSIVLQRDLLK